MDEPTRREVMDAMQIGQSILEEPCEAAKPYLPPGTVIRHTRTGPCQWSYEELPRSALQTDLLD